MSLLDEYAPRMTSTSLATGYDGNGVVTPRNGRTAINKRLPNNPSASYWRRAPRRVKCRACFEGTEAIRAGRELYLQRYPGESNARYDSRVRLAAWENAFKRTVKASTGLMLDVPLRLDEEDNDEKLLAFAKSVNGKRENISVYAERLIENALVDGLAGTFTDCAKVDRKRLDNARGVSESAKRRGKLDSSEVKVLGLRPYFVLVLAEDIIIEHYESIDGEDVLMLFIRREVSEVADGYALVDRVRYLVYRRSETGGNVECEIWEEPEEGGDPVQGETVTMENVKEIPWSPLDLGEKPPLEDLADMNLAYHETTTNIKALQSQALVPTPVRIGATPEEVENEDGSITRTYPELIWGPNNTIEISFFEGMPVKPVYWLSPDVAVLDPAMKTQQLELLSMAKEGGAFLSPDKASVESAEGQRIRGHAQKATLSTVAQRAEDSIALSVRHAATFIGVIGGSVIINREWDHATLQPQEMTALAALIQAGMPVRLAVQRLKAGRIIPQSEDTDEVTEDWEGNQEAEKQAKDTRAQLTAAKSQLALAAGGKSKGTPTPGNAAAAKLEDDMTNQS